MRRIVPSLSGCAVLLAGAAAFMAWTYPALAAAVCAPCTGMERAGPRLVVDPAMPQAQRARLTTTRAAARRKVVDFFGTASPRLDRTVVVACSTAACDRRMGGRGARATTLTTPFLTAIRAGPRGQDETILTHELAHVEIHARAGLRRQISGDLPAWFDEGLAVIVSGDERYVPGGKPVDCGDGAALPASPFDWAPASGRDPDLYAHAACRVLRWMREHGGREAVLRALAAGRELP